MLVVIYRYLTEALVRQGRLSDALELASFAERDAQPEDLYALASLRLAQASVAEGEGNAAAAGARFAEALTLLEQRRVPLDLAEARIAFARALRRFGDVNAARMQLERAAAALAGVDAQLLLDRVDCELAELASGARAARGPHRA